MPIQTIFLDAGGVLVHPNWERVSDCLSRHGVTITASELRAGEPIVKKHFDTEEIIRSTTDSDRFSEYLKLVIYRVDMLKAQCHVPEIALALEELREYNSRWNLWEHVPENVRSTLEALRASGKTLAVLSNSNGTLHRSFERLGLIDLVDYIFDSHEEGIEKPNPEYFLRALQACGSSAKMTVHVGDFYHIDVMGARAAGIRPVLLDSDNLYEEYDCERIRTISELVQLIKS